MLCVCFLGGCRGGFCLLTLQKVKSVSAILARNQHENILFSTGLWDHFRVIAERLESQRERERARERTLNSRTREEKRRRCVCCKQRQVSVFDLRESDSDPSIPRKRPSFRGRVNPTYPWISGEDRRKASTDFITSSQRRGPLLVLN